MYNGCAASTHLVPSYICLVFVVVLNNSNPVAGLLIASRWVLVMRGINAPLVVLLTSNSADADGLDVPMPTLPDELMRRASMIVPPL